MEKIIKVEVLSQRGHDTLMLEPHQALETIRQETTERGKWAYIDGVFAKNDSITLEQVKEASNIILVNQLLGG